MTKLFIGILIGVLGMSVLGCASTQKAAPAGHEMHQTGIESQVSDY